MDKVYFMFHCSVKGGLGHAERASFLLAISAYFYCCSILSVTLEISGVKSLNPILAPVVVIVIGISAIYGTSSYFVKSGRYRRIIDQYGSPRSIGSSKRALYRLFSIGFCFSGSVAAFIASGISLARQLHPW